MGAPETPPQNEVSRLLERVNAGDEAAKDSLAAVVYSELHRIAKAVFNGQARHHTLQPTALVHEAWLKLAGNLDSIEGRSHFFAVAATAMRQVLADHAAAARRQKRGGDRRAVTLHEGMGASPAQLDLIDLDDSLARLGRLNERHARVAELRLLGAMTIPEIAHVLSVSPRTVDVDWSLARVWLWRDLVGE